MPCSNRTVLPAIAARCSGYNVVLAVTAHHQIGRTSDLLFALVNRIIPYSVTLSNAVKRRNFTNGKISDIENELRVSDNSSMPFKYGDDSFNVLSLAREDDLGGLFDVFKVCAIVYRVVPGLKLGTYAKSRKVKLLINDWQKQFTTPGMCFFIENSATDADNMISFRAAISGPGVVDAPINLELARKSGIQILADSRAAVDFPGYNDCIWVEGTRVRQYSSALLKILKNKNG